MRPPALDQFGLVSALRQRADDHNQGGRAGGVRPAMVWSVEAADDLEPLPAAVEVAAYRIVVEAVTNAARHSGAQACVVSLAREDGALRIRVRDDGVGLPEGRDEAKAGLGSNIVRALVVQLEATILAAAAGPGTVVTVTTMQRTRPPRRRG